MEAPTFLGWSPSATVEWACGSRSMRSTRRPSFARPALRLTAVVLLPTPPFWLTKAMVCIFPLSLSCARDVPRCLEYNIQIVNYEVVFGIFPEPSGRDTNRLPKRSVRGRPLVGDGIVKLSSFARIFLFMTAGAPLLFAFQATKADPKAASLDWNQFRGPRRDAQSPETGLLKQWPASGPAVAWKAAGIGTGFSSICHSGKTVFTTGEADGKCLLVAISIADGKVLWKLPIGSGFTEPQGGQGPRSTPATDGNIV